VGNFPVFGKQAQNARALLIFVEHLQALAPGRRLLVVDLAQVHNRALCHLARAQPMTFYDAEVSMLLAIFFPTCATQKHRIRTMRENCSG